MNSTIISVNVNPHTCASDSSTVFVTGGLAFIAITAAAIILIIKRKGKKNGRPHHIRKS